ncbi:Transcription factor BIM2 [Quillaja saponaria]|uniref:Transcription factor BIM2 n=1 Tax=Quillaja saponaria TaxID=32244 RepID=A0AAD7P5Q8_QUISA|nr:Transcription factor BIM2 [Quillaja saponaria]
MRTGKSNQEEDEYEEEEFSSKKDGPSSAPNSNKDAKNNDKASAIRSKHSVTEQRRRSKINERFQILRDLIPHSDQKRDTASFLLEVIEYVQYLQEKVQKYEGSYQGWSPEPTKLMPWRNSHWRVQSFVGQPQSVKNGSVPGSTFPVKLDDSHIGITPTILSGNQNMIEPEYSRDVARKTVESQPELAHKGGVSVPIPLHADMPVPVRSDGVLAHPLQGSISDAQSTECPLTGDLLNQQEELTIEGGTISISSAYSQGLLNSLTQALQSAGLDLSQASISVQIDLGKRADKGVTSGTSKSHENPPSSNQGMAHFRDAGSGEDSDQAQKRLKT